MNKLILIFIWILYLPICNAQEESSSIIEMSNLEFMEGKWKGMAKDSSFYSILEYQFSPEGRLLMATNHLYGKSGRLFGVYEGAYLLENNKFIYFLSGPKGETHRGTAEIKKDTLVHKAIIYPGKKTRSYKSEMILNNDQLFYYANYSTEEKYPEKIDYSSPLIYKRLE